MNMANNFSTVAIGGHPNSGLSLNARYRVRQELITNFVRRNVHIKPAHNHCTMVRQIKATMTRT
jgi:hypothetical protein